MKIYIYARESLQENQDALNRQVETCMKYIQKQFGDGHDIHSYTDAGKERPALDLMLDHLEGVDAVVTVSPDRFARRQAEFDAIEDKILSRGIKLLFVKSPVGYFRVPV